MEQKEVKQHEGKKRKIILKSGRIYTCTIYSVSEPNSEGNALVQAEDQHKNSISFSTEDIEVIETITGVEGGEK